VRVTSLRDDQLRVMPHREHFGRRHEHGQLTGGGRQRVGPIGWCARQRLPLPLAVAATAVGVEVEDGAYGGGQIWHELLEVVLAARLEPGALGGAELAWGGVRVMVRARARIRVRLRARARG
jgi:hypothetical protein